jgi:hypothetical protein
MMCLDRFLEKSDGSLKDSTSSSSSMETTQPGCVMIISIVAAKMTWVTYRDECAPFTANIIYASHTIIIFFHPHVTKSPTAKLESVKYEEKEQK